MDGPLDVAVHGGSATVTARCEAGGVLAEAVVGSDGYVCTLYRDRERTARGSGRAFFARALALLRDGGFLRSDVVSLFVARGGDREGDKLAAVYEAWGFKRGPGGALSARVDDLLT